MVVSQLIGGVAMLLALFVPTDLSLASIWARIVLSSVGKFGITTAFAVIYIQV